MATTTLWLALPCLLGIIGEPRDGRRWVLVGGYLFALGRKDLQREVLFCRKMTAAHQSLPFGTLVRVTNLKNRRTVVVRINDRGPYGGGSSDLTPVAARQLGFSGLVPVELDVLTTPQ